jgi:hypothetical protein
MAVAILSAAAVARAGAGLSVEIGSQGITRLGYNGVVLFKGAPTDYNGFNVIDFTFASGGKETHTWTFAAEPASHWDGSSKTLTQTFSWGTVAAQYTVETDRLKMAITVANTSGQTLQGLNISPMAFFFPVMPKGFEGAPQASFNVVEPGVMVADFGAGAVAVVEEDVGKPLTSGFLSDNTTARSNRYQTWLGSDTLPGQPAFWPWTPNPIAPNSRATYHISFRFGASGSTAATLAPDIIAAYAAANPYTVNWNDRRPIATLFPAGSGAPGRSATNPRGWFNDPNVNVLTQPGAADFSRRLLDYAARSVRILKSMNAQGMITWDLEGEQYPATYIGDPRLATTLAPELAYNDCLDDYFAIFRNAGLAVGLTVRYQKFDYNNGNPLQIEITDPAEEVRTLLAKINFARQQWGCTIFYIDSTNAASPASILEQVHQQCPGVLLIPENPNLGDFSVSAPYETIRKGQVSTPAWIRQVYPSAFSVIDCTPVDPTPVASQLVGAVEEGDILLFQGWFNNPGNQVIWRAYQQAARARARAPAAR